MLKLFEIQKPDLFYSGRKAKFVHSPKKFHELWESRLRRWCDERADVSLRKPSQTSSADEEKRRRRRVVGCLNKLKDALQGEGDEGRIEVEDVCNMDETSLLPTLVCSPGSSSLFTSVQKN